MISLKNILLAGIGTAAYTYEKAVDIVDDMVKKGEITIKQGKELTDELKKRSVEGFDNANSNLKQTIMNIENMTQNELEEIKKKINELELK
ncbi:phasin family protein [Abyssisolibacter fermentans]|uniref:phasin family protein n=1 Tax=Abyssisolibacter fermentans TaxID=1766203 RepID=UPI0008357E22|nr:hypothetical protein [Abyssisolibacter fermentans]